MEYIFIFCRIKVDYRTWIFSGLKAYPHLHLLYNNFEQSITLMCLLFFPKSPSVPWSSLHLDIQYAIQSQSPFLSSEGRKLILCYTHVFSIRLFSFTLPFTFPFTYNLKFEVICQLIFASSLFWLSISYKGKSSFYQFGFFFFCYERQTDEL